MKVPVVAESLVTKLYPRLVMLTQPARTRLVLEDSTGAPVVDLEVGVDDIDRLLDALRDEEFLDYWAEERKWTPGWIEQEEIEEAFIEAVGASRSCGGCEQAVEECECD